MDTNEEHAAPAADREVRKASRIVTGWSRSLEVLWTYVVRSNGMAMFLSAQGTRWPM